MRSLGKKRGGRPLSLVAQLFVYLFICILVDISVDNFVSQIQTCPREIQ